MYCSKFFVENYRCFSQRQELRFAVPQDNRLGSGITYIVGENNAGKTTVIETLWLRDGEKIRDSEKRGNGPFFQLYNENNEVLRQLALIRRESNTLKDEIENKEKHFFEIVTSRRHWQSNVSGEESTETIIGRTKKEHGNPRMQGAVATGKILKNIERNTAKYDEFTKLIQKIIPDFRSWGIGYEDHEYIKYISGDNITHKSDFLGDGVISVIRILAHLFENNQTGLIIDEPELSLHPLAQKKLFQVIAQYAASRQIIVSTHSPYFLDWEYLMNGAVLNRVYKTDRDTSEIKQIREMKDYKPLINGANWQQPYLMDIVSKEIFFQDNLLFVEGQEDVGLLRAFFLEANINLFGYGVRGYANFQFSLELAHNLGIKKACVLIDAADLRLNNSSMNENEIKKKLEGEFSPAYKVIQWNKTDIRDKYDQEGKLIKDGYFDKEGRLKQEANLDDFHQKINEIKAYFESEKAS